MLWLLGREPHIVLEEEGEKPTPFRHTNMIYSEHYVATGNGSRAAYELYRLYSTRMSSELERLSSSRNCNMFRFFKQTL